MVDAVLAPLFLCLCALSFFLSRKSRSSRFLYLSAEALAATAGIVGATFGAAALGSFTLGAESVILELAVLSCCTMVLLSLISPAERKVIGVSLAAATLGVVVLTRSAITLFALMCLAFITLCFRLLLKEELRLAAEIGIPSGALLLVSKVPGLGMLGLLGYAGLCAAFFFTYRETPHSKAAPRKTAEHPMTHAAQFMAFIILATMLAFFAALAIHEIGHALVAIDAGCSVEVTPGTGGAMTGLTCRQETSLRNNYAAGLVATTIVAILLIAIAPAAFRPIGFLFLSQGLFIARTDLGALSVPSSLLFAALCAALLVMALCLVMLVEGYLRAQGLVHGRKR
ncbi:MAG: hypothetical protein V1735_03990 [Nanoarchaeota archaeon]